MDEVPVCLDCLDTHMGRCGGLTYAQRLRSVRLDLSVTPTRTPRNYYDAESVEDVFGSDAKERMDDDTEGLGPIQQRDGRYFQRDRKGDVREVGTEQVARFVEGVEVG